MIIVSIQTKSAFFGGCVGEGSGVIDCWGGRGFLVGRFFIRVGGI